MEKNSQKIKRIDINKEKYLAFVDTETIGTLNIEESVFPFEVGVMVYNNYEHKVEYKKSFIVRKFINNKYIMLCSFSGSKYPRYLKLIENKKLYYVGSVKEIALKIRAVFKRYNINIVVAHNGMFDLTVLERLFNEFGTFNPFKNKDLLDTMEVSRVITNSIEYKNFCRDNKNIKDKINQSVFITNSGRVRLTAQAISCFLKNNPHYKESHTALQDIIDEIGIFEASIQRLGNTIMKLNTTPKWVDYSN